MWWLKILIPVLLAGAIGTAGFIKGIERGVEVEQERHEEEISLMREGFQQSLDRQEEEYQDVIDRHIKQLEAAQALRELDRAREAELNRKIRSLNTTLSEMQGRIYASDIGECTVTSKFDSLLFSASQAGRSTADET